MAGNVQLDDALSNISTTPASAATSGDSVLSRIEASLGGAEPQEEIAETEEEETTSEAPEEEEETPTDTEETEEDEESDEDESDEESDEEDEEGEEDDALELTEDQLALALGLPEGSAKLDEQGNTLIRTKVDGKVDFVPLKDITASYQMEKHLQEKIRVAAEDRKQFEKVKQTETTKLQTSVTEAVSMMQAMEQQMFSEYQGIDFNAIKRDDPGKWAAMQQEIAQKQQQIGQVKGKLGQIISQQQQEQQAANETAKKAKILAETEKLIDQIPSWSDPEKASKEIKTLIPIAEKLGFTEEEVYALDDHRLVLLLRMASKVSEDEETTNIVKKKLKAVPKITKPGSKKVHSRSKDERQKAVLHNNLKKTGSTQDAAAAIFSRL